MRPPTATSEPLSVLLVDDNPQDRALVVRELRKEYPEATTVEVRNRTELVAALDERAFDVVVTDYQLQWATGLHVLRAVKARDPHCPVIMFTATGNEEVAVEAMKSGLDDYIIKNVQHLVRLRVSVRTALEHARTARELRARDAELTHITRLNTLAEMVAGITHEINQPLSAVANYATALLTRLENDGADLERLRDLATRVSQQADRTAEIVRRFRSFARKHKPTLSTFGVSEVLRDGIDLLAFDLRDHRVAVHYELATPDPAVHADRMQLWQVVVNLVRNAYEAMDATAPGERQLQIRTTVTDTRVQVSISDRGRGLPPEGYKRLLDPFVTTKDDGMGMGLAVSLRIVTAHGGDLWATPNDGPGATFHFTLPLRESSERELQGKGAS